MMQRRQARPRAAGGAGRRLAQLAGWIAAGAVLVGLALVVGRPPSESQVEANRSSPTPIPPHPIVFGTHLDPSTNLALGVTDRFRSGDRFAYSVTLDDSPGIDTILVQVLRQESGAEVEVQPPSEQKILPEPRTFAFEVTADRLLAAWGTGSYEMRIYLAAGSPPAAEGRFTLLTGP